MFIKVYASSGKQARRDRAFIAENEVGMTGRNGKPLTGNALKKRREEDAAAQAHLSNEQAAATRRRMKQDFGIGANRVSSGTRTTTNR